MGKLINLTDQQFGRLTVKERGKNAQNGRVQWRCVCECGNTVLVSTKSLRNGDTRSCGCLHIEHAMELVAQRAKPIGHERVTSKGYIEIKTEGGFKRKNVAVMEAHIGRLMEQHEIVHHKDGNKQNNEISNLEIMQNGEHTTRHHTGRKATDETKELISILAKKRCIERGHIGRKLDKHMVIRIKNLLQKEASSYGEIAKMFNVSKSVIGNISKNKIWRNVHVE